MANNQVHTVRRTTFLIDDILRANDDDDDRITSGSQQSTPTISGLESSPECGSSKDYQAEVIHNRKPNARTESISETKMKSIIGDLGLPCRNEFRRISDVVSHWKTSMTSLIDGRCPTPTNERPSGSDANDELAEQPTTSMSTSDYDLASLIMTSPQEMKLKLDADDCRPPDAAAIMRSSRSTMIARRSPLTPSSPRDADGGRHHRDKFSSAAAASALYRLCNMHLSDRQHQQHRHHHHQLHRPDLDESQPTVSRGTTDNSQRPVDEWPHQGHGHWAAALRRAMLQSNFNSELSRSASTDRQRYPFYFRQNSSLGVPGVPSPFPFLNLSRSSGDVITAAITGAGCVAASGAERFSDREQFLRMKCRRNRTVFTEYHLTSLEKNFDRQKYLSTKDRAQLAARLGLSQIQVKTWYQNRRMKWKKQVLQQGGTQPPTKPKGRPRKHEDELNGKRDISLHDGNDIL